MEKIYYYNFFPSKDEEQAAGARGIPHQVTRRVVQLRETGSTSQESSVWEDYVKVKGEDGTEWGICNRCKRLVGSYIHLTTHLKNHSERCRKEAEDQLMERGTNEVRITFKYGGEWVNSNGIIGYVGGTSKEMSASNKVVYYQLKRRLYQRLRMDPAKHDIEIKFLYQNLAIEINSNDDLMFFIGKNARMSHPLCITTKRRWS